MTTDVSQKLSQIRPWRHVARRASREISVGDVKIGAGAPISVQSMTNTLTENVAATLEQIRQLEAAGADIVRVSCPSEDATQALKQIVSGANVPIIADIHFHYARAIEAAKAGAACLRINPGNIGDAAKTRDVIKAAKDYGCSMRIGVNGGSLERRLLEKYKEPCPEAMVASALGHMRILQDLDFHEFKVSVKASDVFLTLAAYRQLAALTDCPLHLGITEAGGLRTGSIKSAIGLGILLAEGIGDTLRVSLAADPVEEVAAGFEILKSLGLRHRGVSVIACPSCARQGFDVIATTRLLEERLAHISAPITVSLIGCVVNGPGEAALSDVGFTGGGADHGMVYVAGQMLEKIQHEDILDRLVALVEDKAKTFDPAQ